MLDSSSTLLSRRAFVLGAGAGTGLLLARALGARGLFAPDAQAASYEATLRALSASLTPKQRELIVFPADHPSRQIVNTIAVLERPHLGTLLSPTQRALVERLYETMLSPRGRDAFAGTIAVEGRLDGCVLAIYGEPDSGHAQTVIMGGHVMLRGGSDGAESAAFGGGIAYGHRSRYLTIGRAEHVRLAWGNLLLCRCYRRRESAQIWRSPTTAELRRRSERT